MRRTNFDKIYPGISIEDRAQAEIRKVSAKAAVAGAMALVGASTGELALAVHRRGSARSIGLPAMAVSMLLEAAYMTALQIDLACDVGLIYGIPFDPDDFGEIATLFGLALDIDVYSKKDQQEEDDR